MRVRRNECVDSGGRGRADVDVDALCHRRRTIEARPHGQTEPFTFSHDSHRVSSKQQRLCLVCNKVRACSGLGFHEVVPKSLIVSFVGCVWKLHAKLTFYHVLYLLLGCT